MSSFVIGHSSCGEQPLTVIPRALPFIGVHNLLHQRMPHNVHAGETGEGNAFDTTEHMLGVNQAALLALLQINLRRVAGDHRLGGLVGRFLRTAHPLLAGGTRGVDGRVVEGFDEEVANELRLRAEALMKSGYGSYLLGLLDRGRQ